MPSSNFKWGILGILAFLGYVAAKLGTQTAQGATTSGGSTVDTGGNAMMYNTAILTPLQQQNAALIDQAAQANGLNSAFMIALSVTESSLGLKTVGDDGVSIGLFQINLNYQPGETAAALQDPAHNADVAMGLMNALIAQYPGHTYMDYAVAWSTGGRGEFVSHHYNPAKVAAMARAVADLQLDLDLYGVPNAA
jgi:hypothetical protein